MSSHVTSTPAPSSDPGARGKFGVTVLGIGALAVAAWLGVRVVAKTAENKQIEAKRAVANSQGEKLQSVKTLAPVPATWVPVVPLEGTIEAEQRALLAFKVGGRLTFVGPRLGDTVKAGQLLGRLDASEASAQQNAAAAQLKAAQAQYALAGDAERRTVELVKGGALAEANGVQAEQQRALAEAQAAAAQAQLGLASTSLSNHTLTAPFAGTITRAPTTRGSVVGPGEPLFEVVDASKLRLRGTVTESDAALLKAGAKVSIEGAGGNGEGSLRTVLGVLDQRTRRVPVEADLDPTSTLRVGAFVRATVTTETPINVLKVPGSVLRPGSQDVVLAVIDGKLVEKHITFAVDSKTGELLVRAGIASGDQLVDAPRPESRDGERVVLAAAPAQ